MNAVEATLWTIGSMVGLSVAFNVVHKLWPSLDRDRGAGALAQALVYVALLGLIRFVYFPATPAGKVLGARAGRWYYYPIALALGVAIQFPASGLYDAILARYPAELPTTDLAEVFATLPVWKKAMTAAGLLVATPLVEELFFRGALFGALRRRQGAASVVLMTAMLFALIHVQPQMFLPIGIVGAALAFLRVASGSLWPGFLCHAAFNGVTLYAIATDPGSQSAQASEPMPVSYVLIGTVVTASLLALTDHLRARDRRAGDLTTEEPS